MRRVTLTTIVLFFGVFGCLENVGAQTCQRSLLPVNQVPEARSGFGSPVDFTSTKGGFSFREYAAHPTYPCGWVRHPGWDMNHPNGGDSEIDRNEPIRAAADGIVVWIGNGSPQWVNGQLERKMTQWGSIVIQHNYQGRTYLSQYGHARSVNGNLTCGQTVYKGWIIGRIGKEGADFAHLHYEIRKGNHYDPTNGNFFCDRPWWSNIPALQNWNLVTEWYENPDGFHWSHGPYQSATVSEFEGDIRRVLPNSTFISGTYGENLNWNGWELRSSEIWLNGRWSMVYHITDPSNRRTRYYLYLNPNTNVWEGWYYCGN